MSEYPFDGWYMPKSFLHFVAVPYRSDYCQYSHTSGAFLYDVSSLVLTPASSSVSFIRLVRLLLLRIILQDQSSASSPSIIYSVSDCPISPLSIMEFRC